VPIGRAKPETNARTSPKRKTGPARLHRRHHTQPVYARPACQTDHRLSLAIDDFFPCCTSALQEPRLIIITRRRHHRDRSSQELMIITRAHDEHHQHHHRRHDPHHPCSPHLITNHVTIRDHYVFGYGIFRCNIVCIYAHLMITSPASSPHRRGHAYNAVRAGEDLPEQVL
jgi:hypothetical protein